MDNIESMRSRFFPKGNRSHSVENGKDHLRRNDKLKKEKIDQIASKNVKINIPDAVKDFSRIKRAADKTPNIDQSEKIAALKKQIQEGNYDINYDSLVNKILTQEF